ncbi:MAG: hypothetical protein ACYCT1_02175 [Steroidobacteraceae bacterium]
MTYGIEQARPQGVASSAQPGEGFLTIEVPRESAEREFGAEVLTEEEADE